MLLEAHVQFVKPGVFVLADTACGNSRPDFDDVGKLLNAERDFFAGGLQLIQPGGKLQLVRFDLGDLLEADLVGTVVGGWLAFERFSFGFLLEQAVADLVGFVELR